MTKKEHSLNIEIQGIRRKNHDFLMTEKNTEEDFKLSAPDISMLKIFII